MSRLVRKVSTTARQPIRPVGARSGISTHSSRSAFPCFNLLTRVNTKLCAPGEANPADQSTTAFSAGLSYASPDYVLLLLQCEIGPDGHKRPAIRSDSR